MIRKEDRLLVLSNVAFLENKRNSTIAYGLIKRIYSKVKRPLEKLRLTAHSR